MPTSDNKPNTSPAAADPSQPSERAKAIARRSFLRKSVGVAAPVVMTLQSGPALAIRSITCQDKTGTLEVSNFSGFTGTTATIPGGSNDADVIPRLSTDPTSPDGVVTDADTLDTDPGNGGTPNLIRLGANDGFARCTDTSISTDPPTAGGRFTGTGPWVFQGPDGSLVADPTIETGPIAMFSIDANGENIFEGCYGDGTENQADANGVLNRPMTNSCWSSLLS